MSKKKNPGKRGGPTQLAARLPKRLAHPLKQFCKSIGVSYWTGLRASEAGKLHTVRFGNLILVPAEEVERVTREGL